MPTLQKTIKNKTIYLKSFKGGVIESTENKAEAMQFPTTEAANQYAKQSLSTLTWRAE